MRLIESLHISNKNNYDITIISVRLKDLESTRRDSFYDLSFTIPVRIGIHVGGHNSQLLFSKTKKSIDESSRKLVFNVNDNFCKVGLKSWHYISHTNLHFRRFCGGKSGGIEKRTRLSAS